MGIDDRREFPRFATRVPALCVCHGKQMIGRTINISLGGMKLEANFDLGAGESMVLDILTNGVRIRCRGKILAIEEFSHRVHARLRIAPTSDAEHTKLSDYLHSLYWGCFQKWVVGAIFILSAYIVYLFLHPYFFQ